MGLVMLAAWHDMGFEETLCKHSSMHSCQCEECSLNQDAVLHPEDMDLNDMPWLRRQYAYRVASKSTSLVKNHHFHICRKLDLDMLVYVNPAV